MNILIKHLEIIENVINRMATNCFTLKGWAVTLVAGVFTLASKDTDKIYFLIAYIPIILFWGLDSYYLLQERLYRDLYNRVRVSNPPKIDFEMKIDFPNMKTGITLYFRSLLSITEIFFYGPLAILSAIIVCL